MHFERWAFAQALMDYFVNSADPPQSVADVIAALGMDASAYRLAHSVYEKQLLRSVSKGDLSLPRQFATIYTQAKADLAAKRPTLDEVRKGAQLSGPRLAETPETGGVDETVLLPVHVPAVVLPFASSATGASTSTQSAPRAPSIARPSASAPRQHEAGEFDQDATLMAPALVPTPALPFVGPSAADTGSKKKDGG
jgi:hypothetical protein